MDITVRIPVTSDWLCFAGKADCNLKVIRESLGINIAAREGVVQLQGDKQRVCVAKAVIDRLAHRADAGTTIEGGEVLDFIAEESAGHEVAAAAAVVPSGTLLSWEGDLDVYAGGRKIRPRTDNQIRYIEAIRNHDLVFGKGPAGTGKTYLAVAAAVHLLKQDRVRKIVLVRPAVEAGEKLGFLPGDLEAKVHPYLRPLLDALHDMVDFTTIRRFLESDVLEIAPLAYMRGRTLNHSVVILDEAQNTTASQMKMFLTRLGHGSKMIVTGDPSQIDLNNPAMSGLLDAARRFREVPGVAIIKMDGEDVVRHPLVQRIISSYVADERHH